MRNPVFTGRGDLLQSLSLGFQTGEAQALSGLGGVGKTRVALEYVYQHDHEYSYIFWLKAATYELLVNDFVAIGLITPNRLSPHGGVQNRSRVEQTYLYGFDSRASIATPSTT